MLWNDHGSIIAAKATRVFNFLRRTMYNCSRDSKHGSFCAFVLPILEYACHVEPFTQKCVEQVELIQCRGAKWVCGAQYNSSNFTRTPSSVQCCTLLKWPPLADRRKFCIIQTLHDILHHHIYIDFNSYFTVSSTYTRSHSLSLFCRQASINAFRYSFS